MGSFLLLFISSLCSVFNVISFIVAHEKCNINTYRYRDRCKVLLFYRRCLVSEMSHISIHAASESCQLCDHTGNCSRWKMSANCQQQFGQFELIIVLSQMSRLLWVLPSSPHVCEHSDQADHSDSWQLTGHSTTQEMFICHFFSKFNCSTRRERKGVIRDTSSNHSVTAQPTQSVTARQQLDLSALQFPEAFVLAVDRLCWAASGQQSWNIEGCCESHADTMCFCEWARWWSGPRVK